MERFKRLIPILCLVAALVIAVPVIAQGQYYGTILVSNNSSADTYISTNISGINTPLFISAGYLNSGANNTSITYGGSNIAFMPGYDTSPWVMMVPSIAANSTMNYQLNTGVTPGSLRYFPASAGMTTSDNTTLEYGDNFTYELSGFVDVTQVGDNISSKIDAIRVYNYSSGNITAAITDNMSGTTATGWTNSDNAIDGDIGTAATYSIGYNGWSAYLLMDAGNQLNHVGYYYAKTAGGGTISDIEVSANISGAWVTLFSQAVGAQSTWNDVNAGDWYEITQYRVRFKNSGGAVDSATCSLYEIAYTGETARTSVSGLSSGEKVISVYGANNYPDWATGNILNFDGTANSYLTPGVTYNASQKMWISFRFVLNADWTVGGGNQNIFGKYVDSNNHITAYLRSGNGKLNFWHRSGAVDLFELQSSQTSWVGGTEYHVLLSTSNTSGARLRIENGTAVTSTDKTAIPNGGNLTFGSQRVGIAGAFDGYITNIIVGTDDLSAAEETALYNGTAPGDETDYWYIDEGTGTDVISYGTDGNDGSIGASTNWTTGTRLCDFILDVDGTTGGINLKGVTVPDNSNDWVDGGDATPYIEYVERTVDGNQVQYIGWDYATTFIDRSGNSNDATPSFRTTCSNSSVNATLVSFLPSEQAQAPAWAVGAGPDFLDPTFAIAGGNFTANITAGKFPGQGFIEELSTAANSTPDEFPMVIIFTFVIVMVSIIIGAFLREQGSTSLAVKGIAIIACIGLAMALDAYNEYMMVFFVMAWLGFLFASRERRLGG